MSEHADGWLVGDRVEVGSLWRRRWKVKPRPGRPGISGELATGHIAGFNSVGGVVEFDCGPVNGETFCTAAPDELTRIEEFDSFT